MRRTQKVAVTIEREVLGAVERIRRQTGESRSALVNRALRHLVSWEARRARVEQYVRAYREHPETEAEVKAAARVAAETLEGLEW